MNLRMGSQVFQNVQIPLLWGTRAVVQDRRERLSVINLAGDRASLEILADSPAAGTGFLPKIDGFVVSAGGIPLYSYNPTEKTLSSISLGLPECQISRWGTRIGSNQFSGNMISGFGVGIAVTPHGIAMGAPLPDGLAKLVV